MTEVSASCRACGKTDPELILSLGVLPLADVLLTKEQLGRPEISAKLDLVFCERCALAQTRDFIAPETLYEGDYPYYSSVSGALLRHFAASADDLIRSRKLDGNSLVIEAASNDGYMLKSFVERGVPVLGVDPARGPAEAAERVGVPTRCTFFEKKLAEQLRAEGQLADVFLANACLNLVPDINGFVEGIDLVLKDDGIAVLEVPYVVDMIDKCAFDMIFHQNLYYFSVTAVDKLLRKCGLFVNEVRHLPEILGGSMRLFVEKRQNVGSSVTEVLNSENGRGVPRIGYYREFAERVGNIKRKLLEMLRELKADGKKLAVYGAAGGMATTLLNYVGIDRQLIEFAVDLNERKHGRFAPGTRLEIFPPQKLLDEKVDYTLLLAWNFAEEVFQQQAGYIGAGGRFIVPIPEPHVV